ncbi:MAG: transposase [Olsenella sp.]|nr:transposase [Olsenella sp.]MCI1644599.1 transposase [Olsenella sp.]MCI1794258.1 transposase [Olsenella sp.]MCI1879581.1 transposase [Olsenella sp.]
MARILIGGAARQAFAHCLTCVRCAKTDKRQLEKQAKEEARRDRRAAARALSCIKGIDEISAFCLAAEAGCLPRFPTAPEHASWCGLIPSEHSSGERGARGHITKAGNAASRRALVEGAWRHAGCSARPKQIPNERDAPAVMRPRGNACTTRLVGRCERLPRTGNGQSFRCRLRPRARLLGLGDGLWGGRRLSQAAASASHGHLCQEGPAALDALPGAARDSFFGQLRGRVRRKGDARTRPPGEESSCGITPPTNRWAL